MEIGEFGAERALLGTGNRNQTPESIERSDLSETTERTRNIFYTDKIIKFCVCFFHKRKLHAVFLSAVMVILQWYTIAGYFYGYFEIWYHEKNITMPRKNGENETKIAKKHAMPIETFLLLLGLSASGAMTASLAVYYYYSSKNYFSDQQGSFSLVPLIEMEDGVEQSACKHGRMSNNEWLISNILFLVGVITVLFVLGADFGTDSIFDFKGLRKFLKNNSTTLAEKVIYIPAVTMLYWGFFATVCACCIFHIMSREIIAYINQTERLVLYCTTTRQQFFEHHKRMMTFTEKMIKKFNCWFAIHNAMFIVLLATMIFEWIYFIKNAKDKPRIETILLSQVPGTLLICYKFAFPFFSASRVTTRFTDFYLRIAMSNKFSDIPELLLFPNYSGFHVYGLRITPNVALVAFLSSFVGLLKFAF